MKIELNKPQNKPIEYMKFGKDARDYLVKGVTLMYDAVCSTLSPKGRNVAIARQFGPPIVVHDGVTVAKEVKSTDEFVQMGINLVREAAQKTNEEAGDGTTTSILIAYELVVRGLDLVKRGLNPMILRKQLYKALSEIGPLLKRISKPAKTQKNLERVATISSADEHIGQMVGEAVHKVGQDGLVTVEESGSFETYINYTEGMTIDKGFASPYFVTNPKRMEAVIKKPVIAIVDKTITVQRELVPLIETMVKGGKKDIVIIGEVKGDALGILVNNKMRGNINAIVINPPGYGENRREYLEDLAILTGSTVFSDELGLDAEQFAHSFDINWLGSAGKLVATKKTTMIINGGGDKKAIAAQIKKIKYQLKKTESRAERERLEERLAKMTTGVAVVRVGAKTEIEAREKLERVKDAVGSATAAMEEGVVPGSGVTFMNLAKAIKGDSPGACLLREALHQPLRKVMANSGESTKRQLFGLLMSEVDLKVKLIKEFGADWGYDCSTGGIREMIKSGIIDPTKVIRLCIENGVGVATSILTTDTLIDIQPARKQSA